MSAADEMHRRWAGDPCRACAPGLLCVACMSRAPVRGDEVEDGDDEIDDDDVDLDNARREALDVRPGLGRVLVATLKTAPSRRRRQP